MKRKQKKNLKNINRVRVELNQNNNSQIFLLLINYCPFSGLYSGTSLFMDSKAELKSRFEIASLSSWISFWRTSDSWRGSSEEKMRGCFVD